MGPTCESVPVPGIGFLHTSPANVTTFETLVARWPGVRAYHVVDEELLDLARESLDGRELRRRVQRAVDELRGTGVDVVVCTCSTVGGLAEEVGGDAVLRVDRPAAEQAVATGRRIGVVVALESTVVPTRELLLEQALVVGRAPQVDFRMAEGAWAAWEDGDVPGYLRAVAAAARLTARTSDVVLLAQASMAGAVELLEDLEVPVVTTPGAAVDHAAQLLLSREVSLTGLAPESL